MFPALSSAETRRPALQFAGGMVVQALVIGVLIVGGFGSGRQPTLRKPVRVVSLTLPQKPLQQLTPAPLAVVRPSPVRVAPMPRQVSAAMPQLELPPPPPIAVASVVTAPAPVPLRLPAPQSGFTPAVAPVAAQSTKPKSEVGMFSSAAADGEGSRAGRRQVEVTGFESQSLSPRSRAEAKVVAATSFDLQTAPVRGRSPSRSEIDPSDFKPVEILTKPNPQYTAQARQLGIEGEVEVRVLFGETGKVRVLSIQRGLGYGLDENAAIAVNQIRFHPATRKGVPVEQAAVIRVQFQLAR